MRNQSRHRKLDAVPTLPFLPPLCVNFLLALVLDPFSDYRFHAQVNDSFNEFSPPLTFGMSFPDYGAWSFHFVPPVQPNRPQKLLLEALVVWLYDWSKVPSPDLRNFLLRCSC